MSNKNKKDEAVNSHPEEIEEQSAEETARAEELAEIEAEEKKAKEKAKAKAEAAADPNKGIDVFARGAGLSITLPTSDLRAFESKAKVFGIKGRNGKGPCECIKKFELPNGDIILTGDTFDPVEEKMHAGLYGNLLKRKYFTAGGEKVETKLLEIAAKK